MTFKDTSAKRILNRTRSVILNNMINSLSEDDRKGRSDLQVVEGAIREILKMFEKEDGKYYKELQEAQEILDATKNGTIFYIEGFDWTSSEDSDITSKYTGEQIDHAKYLRGEYKRLKCMINRIEAFNAFKSND